MGWRGKKESSPSNSARSKSTLPDPFVSGEQLKEVTLCLNPCPERVLLPGTVRPLCERKGVHSVIRKTSYERCSNLLPFPVRFA